MEKNLKLIDLNPVKPVAGIAEMPYVKIKKIIQSQNEDVYNLEADKFHNFAVNGGLIVHNCMDALRYGLVELKDTQNRVSEANLRLLRQGRRRF